MKKSLRRIIRKAKLSSPNTVVAFLLLLALPLITVFLVQQRQDIRQRAQTAPAPVAINIIDFQFSPGTITVPVGTRITWTNRSNNGVPHTTSSDVTGGSNSWDSGILTPGNSFSRTFSTTGTFAYHCNVHGAAVMSGRIIVVPNTTQPTPTSLVTPRADGTPIPEPSGQITTPNPTTQPYSTPTPIAGDPPYTCLGSCPTPTPTMIPTPLYKKPTPAPKYGYLTPTPVYNQPAPTSYMNPAAPTPCATGYTTAASDNATSIAATDNTNGSGNQNGGTDSGLFQKIIEFILNLFFKIIELLFGINLAPPAPSVPAPVVETPAAIPSVIVPNITVYPSLPDGIPAAPYATPTLYGSPAKIPAPCYPAATVAPRSYKAQPGYPAATVAPKKYKPQPQKYKSAKPY